MNRLTDVILVLLGYILSTMPLSAQKPIIKISDPSRVTNSLKIGKVILGFNKNGGGYLNYCSINGSKNIVPAYYGRGWQGSIRDRFHSGRYNPTQAGFRDYAGTPVNIQETKNGIFINTFNLPLFSGPFFDFTEHEDLAPDNAIFPDMNKKDNDKIDESDKTQDEEVRSEFDYTANYKIVQGAIPIVRFYQRYLYKRKPDAIKQFNKNGIMINGKQVLNEKFRINDISKTMKGNQVAKDTDLSYVVFTAYGIRLKAESGYHIGWIRTENRWQKIDLFKMSGDKKRYTLKTYPDSKSILDYNLLLISNSEDSKNSSAIALYVPESHINKYQTIGFDTKTNKVVYEEDRRIKSLGIFIQKIKKIDQLGIRIRYIIRGLLSPERTPKDIVEGLRNETFILFGSPDEILNSVKVMEKKLVQ